MGETLIDVEDLKKYFISSNFASRLTGREEALRAVDGVSFDIYRGETFGLVGETGCGKSTLGRTIIRLYEPTDGKIYFKNTEITSIKGSSLRKLRKDMQIVFQDPLSSLNPKKRIMEILWEPLRLHNICSEHEKERKIFELLELVGLSKADRHKYPHELSGGMLQRVNIARALAVDPDFIVLDEPTSALDVSIQAQILNLLRKLQNEFRLTYLFISHDLGIIHNMCDRIAVMYLGRIVEVGDWKVFENPMHPYTKALLSCVPSIRKESRKNKILLKGAVPSPVNIPSGCRFHPRCFLKEDICSEIEPDLKEVKKDRYVACHLYQ
jgi:oligopeptide/dipeptide ABC transporter ATP-binding protein